MRVVVIVVTMAAILAGLLTGCPKPPPPTPEPAAKAAQPAPKAAGEGLTLFVGSASKPAMDDLAKAYETKSGAKIEITFGGSGALLTQFAQEQYGDLYIPGSDDFMDKAEQKDTVLADSRTPLAYLVPAILVPQGNPKGIHSLEDLAKPGLRVVIGDRQAVCLGVIGKAMLEEAGLWAKVQPNIASYATSCENVLQSLLLGEADVVIGWDVFARQHPDKVTAVALPAKLARPRNIPAAIIKWSRQPDAARAFITYLASPESKEVWKKHGYTTEAPTPAPPAGK